MTEQAIQKSNGAALTKGAQTIEQMLASRSEFLRSVLPRHITPERLMKVALLARSRNPLLLQCTPESLVKAILQSAEMGLEPSGSVGGAHLVPFKNKHTGHYEATLIPDYRGLIDLARRSGQIRSIEAHVIHERDKYRVRYGSEPILEHEPLLVGETGKMVAVYAVAKLADGATQVEVMTSSAVEAIKNRSRASTSGPWVTDYEAMAKKTVLRQLCKYLPRSRELAEALDLDDASETGVEPLVDLALPADAQAQPKPSRTEKVKAALAAKATPAPSPSPPTRTSAGIVDVPTGMSEEEAQAIIAAENAEAEAQARAPEPGAGG